MTLRQFAGLVAEMRNAQRAYFRTKGMNALEMSKRLEKQVDKALVDLLSPQGTLFDTDEDDR